jgi:PRTRC genetic system protein F
MSTFEHDSVGPPAAGCFFLPAIDAAIPVQLDQGQKRSTVLSRFASAAEAVGVHLPPGEFQTIEQVVQTQWTHHVRQQFPSDSFQVLVGAPTISVVDDHLEILIGSESTLTAFRVKTVIEALESALPGLGWFVHEQIDSATSYGHEIYSMGFVGYMLDGLCWEMDDFTDDSYARAMLMEEGSEPPKGPIDAETMERLRGDYSHWPSSILEEVDGHGHLLGWSMAGRRPRRASPKAAQQWLAKNRRHRHAEVVRLALELQIAFKCADRNFVWNISDDETETIGALCFVAWDSPVLLFEAVSHHEQNQYNGGDAVEAFARRRLPINDKTTDLELRQLAKSTAEYINRWALLEKLLSKFPSWDGDDDEI